MRIRITFVFSDRLRVPLQHEHLLHGLIYHLIRDEAYREQLHNVGFKYGKRFFKMFCFSKLFGRHIIEDHHIVFSSPVSFIFSTHDERLIRELMSSLFTREFQMIGHHQVRLESIEQIDQPVSEHMMIRFLTPVTAYSTFVLNSRKKTHFWHPSENEFQEQVLANACKKYEAIHGVPASDPKLELIPVDRCKLRQKVVMFKQTIIKGWMGDFYLQGSPELIQTVYNVGIGSKNSNSMGLFKVIKHMERSDSKYA